MASSKYTLVPKDSSEAFLDEKTFSPSIGPRPSLSLKWRNILLMLGTSLLASLSINAYLISAVLFQTPHLYQQLPSKYAHLQRNVPTEILDHSDFDSVNRTTQDAAWNDQVMEPWNNFVALDEEYVKSQGLPHSQRWPWDTSKGVYVLTSAHELHCVHTLREAINENHDGVPEAEQTWNYPHLLHCLNVLRESVVCNADDTPLYVGRLHKNILSEMPKAGTGTIKMCRNWQSLLSWSYSQSACYRPVHWNEEGFDEIERYKFCPDGARPWENVAQE